MDGFQRTRNGQVVAVLTGVEADILRLLASQLVELLRNEQAAPRVATDPLEAMLDFSGPTNEPDDPVLQRLFPSAYRNDEEAAGEFRRFTEGTLRDGKASNAALIIDTLEEAGLPQELGNESLVIDVELGPGDVMAWMKSFTDMRLALGTSLGVEEGDDEYWLELPDDDPRTWAHNIYSWLGFLQETLVEAAEP